MSPKRLPTACAWPSCPEVTTERFCPKHRKANYKEQDRDRPSSSERGYDTRTWGKFRRWYLRRHPLCERCQAQGKTATPSKVVHHVTPLREGGERLDPANCEALCETCHRRHHGFGGQGTGG